MGFNEIAFTIITILLSGIGYFLKNVHAEIKSVIEEQKNNPFLGRQRVYTLTDKSIPRIILNVDLSAWCRHDQLGELIENLRRTSR